MNINTPATTRKSQNSQWVRRTVCTLLIFTLAAAITSAAQSQNIFARFINANGGSPTSLVQGPDGNFYGVGIVGGNNAGGRIFKVSPTGTITPLYTFCFPAPCQDGKTPNGLVLASDGNFYGTTFRGGPRDSGSIFRLTPTGGVSIFYSFCTGVGPCLGGTRPQGDLIQGTDGALYGTTSQGGIQNGGTVFKITLSGVFTSLYSFCSQSLNCADGVTPGRGAVGRVQRPVLWNYFERGRQSRKWWNDFPDQHHRQACNFV